MNVELQALLAVQRDDADIRALERRRRSFEPRLLDLERRRQIAADGLDRARQAADAQERRLHELQQRIHEHRSLHERNVAQLEQVRRTRDAAAAVSQVEQARRILADEESGIQTATHRLHDARQGVALQEQALADVDSEQTETRREVEAEMARLDAALADARARRSVAATGVSALLLGRYERIEARRHDDAVYSLRGASCASCDTALPLQRRSVMARTGSIEVCEACGVLLYATE